MKSRNSSAASEVCIMRAMIINFVALFCLSATALANPIPWPPPASMPLEDMKINIQTLEGSLYAQFSGDFTFDYIPNEVCLMMFPVPPDATNIQVSQDGAERSWRWSSENYTTILPEMPTIPMIEWEGPFPVEGCVFTVEYEHSLIEHPEEYIFFYALGTGKYFQTYDKTTTAYFDIRFPSAYKVDSVCLDNDPHDYQVLPMGNISQLKIVVQSEFGLITKDLIVSLVAKEQCITKEIYGEPSEQAEILRHFRDNVLGYTSEGQELIRLYYQWSPAIVKTMEEDEEFKEEVKELIDGILTLINREISCTY
jgi:hypothetical protein